MRHHLAAILGIGLSVGCALAITSFTADESDVCRMLRDTQEREAQLKEKRRRRQVYVEVEKELAAAVARGRLSLEQAAQELADHCLAEYPCQLEYFALEFGETLSALDLAEFGLLQSVRYYRRIGALPRRRRAVGRKPPVSSKRPRKSS
jgi:hypothetical protein